MHLDGDQLAPAVARWGSLEPERQGKPARSKLDAHEAFILDLVNGRKDIALHEIAERLAREQDLKT